MAQQSIEIKRVYESPSEDDGYRVLVDRIWPRGVSKEEARLDEWCKQLAPSDELRKWFDHDPEKFDTFRSRYRRELEDEEKQEQLDRLARKSAEQKVTLLYGAKDESCNQAVVLQELLRGRESS